MPIVRGLEKEYGGQVRFIWVNILMESSIPLMEQYGFATTPEFHLVNSQGQALAFWDEVTAADDLRPALDQALDEQADPGTDPRQP